MHKVTLYGENGSLVLNVEKKKLARDIALAAHESKVECVVEVEAKPRVIKFKAVEEAKNQAALVADGLEAPAQAPVSEEALANEEAPASEEAPATLQEEVAMEAQADKAQGKGRRQS